MRLKQFIGAVLAGLAITAAATASAEELVGGRLVYELLVGGLKQQLTPQPAQARAPAAAQRPNMPGEWRTVGAAEPSPASCEVLRWDRKGFNKPTLGITRPGNYCLDQDYEFDCSPFAHGCSGELIEIRANDVDVDFRGHTLRVSGTRGYGGVRGYGRNIRIHNGAIDGVGLGILLSAKGSSPLSAYPAMPVDADARFVDTGFVVESMRFRNVHIAVMVAGSGNQIRNNQIDALLENRVDAEGQPATALETNPQFAMLSYGPAARIEGNTLRLATRTRGLASYALYLRSGDATVVRNNNVRIDGARAGSIGVGLSNSADVVLQSNTMDAEKTVDSDGRSSYRTGASSSR
jgi:hypothetical protein